MIWIPILLMFGAYLIMSLLLFFFPTLVHTPHRHPKTPDFQAALNNEKVLRIAHRGGARIRTQNTIEAFQQALKHSDMLQFDVCETKDGVLVLQHDHNLQRTCGVNKLIKDLQYKDLPPFKESIELNFAPQGKTIKSRGEKIPTLEEVFIKFPDVPMNIELKSFEIKAIKKFVGLINAYNRKHITIAGIRDKRIEELIDYDPHVMRFMGDREFFFYFIAMIFGFLPYLYITEHTMQVPLWTQESYHWKVRQWGDNWKVHLFFKILKLSNYLMKILSYHLKKRGIMTYYWVCNSQEDFKKAIKFGADGIMTDDPPLLSEFLMKAEQKYESAQQQLTRQNKEE